MALARLHRDRNNVPGALVELTQAIDEYGQGGAGGAAAAYVEMAEAERARGAQREVLEDLYKKALERDPASCDALWGAGKLEHEVRGLERRGEGAARRLRQALPARAARRRGGGAGRRPVAVKVRRGTLRFAKVPGGGGR